MKIVIKSKDMRFKLPMYVPLSMCIFFINKYSKSFSKYSDSVNEYFRNIDPDALSESLEILKEYKGLKIVDIKDSEGNIVEITV